MMGSVYRSINIISMFSNLFGNTFVCVDDDLRGSHAPPCPTDEHWYLP